MLQEVQCADDFRVAWLAGPQMDHIELKSRDTPLVLVWPTPQSPAGFVHFGQPAEWRDFIGSLGIDPRCPRL